MNLSFQRTGIGQYRVSQDGEQLGRVRTSLQNHHWYWVAISNDGHLDRQHHYNSRDAAAAALIAA